MGHTAVIHAVRYFSDIKFVVNQKFFYTLNFVFDDKLLQSDTGYFGKKICEISIVIIQFFC